MLRAVKILGVLGMCLGLAACPGGVRTPEPAIPTPQPTQPTPTPAPEPAPSAPIAPTATSATLFTIDPAASSVNILVYRGGLMARLGHNHVMTAKSVTGRIMLDREPARSTFELSFPVAELVVDDAEARRVAGPDFPDEIPPKDREGTRKNMLKPEVLDGERFARVQLQSVKVTGPLSAARVVTRITIKNVSRDVEVPVSIATTPTRLTASGQFTVKQTDFGIEPFSIGMGALQVVDELKIGFSVVALKR